MYFFLAHSLIVSLFRAKLSEIHEVYGLMECVFAVKGMPLSGQQFLAPGQVIIVILVCDTEGGVA